jgi:hypothetical protein
MSLHQGICLWFCVLTVRRPESPTKTGKLSARYVPMPSTNFIVTKWLNTYSRARPSSDCTCLAMRFNRTSLPLKCVKTAWRMKLPARFRNSVTASKLVRPHRTRLVKKSQALTVEPLLKSNRFFRPFKAGDKG